MDHLKAFHLDLSMEFHLDRLMDCSMAFHLDRSMEFR